MDKEETTKDRFWAKFVEPEDSEYRAKTLNNEPLIITGTAKEICEFIEGEKDMQLRLVAREFEKIKVIDMPIDFEDKAKRIPRESIFKAGQLNVLMRLPTAIEIIKKYAKYN